MMDKIKYFSRQDHGFYLRSRSNHSVHLRKKGFTQIDYIIATGIFLVVFALVVQYVGNFFSGVVATTNIRIMTTEANDMLGMANKASIPQHWPYITPNNSVVLYMQMDNSVVDAVTGGGEKIGNVLCSATGKFYLGCHFENSCANITHSAAINFDTFSNFSVEFWINYSRNAQGNGIAEKSSGGSYPYSFRYVQGDKISFSRYDGTNNPSVTSAAAMTNGTMYHVLATVNGTRAMNLYINGTLDNTTTDTTTSPTANSANLYVGCGNGSFFNGTLDEFIVWNRPLSAAEVRQLYDNYNDYGRTLNRIGLADNAYTFTIVVNNSRAAWKNQSKAWANLTNELVAFNYSDFGLPAAVSSTMIYDDDSNQVAYNATGTVITFATNISVNTTKNFTAYFNIENFADRSVSVAGSDNLTERLFAPRIVNVIPYRKMAILSNANYTSVKNSTQLPRNFRIALADIQGPTVFFFGPTAPPSGNIVATRLFTVYQNATAGIRGATLNVQVW